MERVFTDCTLSTVTNMVQATLLLLNVKPILMCGMVELSHTLVITEFGVVQEQEHTMCYHIVKYGTMQFFPKFNTA